MKINANEFVGRGFPTEEGRKLARTLLEDKRTVWDELEIDLSGLAPALLISAFFNGFLQEVFDRNSALLSKARQIHWGLQFSFQKTNVDSWMTHFKPSQSA